jgi:2-polyprenyl-3-methyl-5-hydroxy-6-metoxy-1,4-benzoquinol methylase
MDQISGKYDYQYENSTSRYHHYYLIKPLLTLLAQSIYTVLEPGTKPRLLDIGSGNGSLTHFLAQQGYEVVGVEPSESGIQLANKSFPDCTFIQSDIYQLPDAKFKGQFDIVIAVEVIEHLFYPRELIKAAKNCLKPHGIFVLTTPYHGYIKNVLLALSGKMDQHFTSLWDGGHIKFFSVETLTNLLQSENFTNIQFKFAGRYPYCWKSMLCASHPRLMDREFN